MMQVILNGRPVTREAVLAWEAKRMAAVRRTLALPPATTPLADQRRDLLAHKLALGHARLRAIIARKLWLSERMSRVMVALSGKARRFSVCEILVAEGSAEGFAHWFEQRNVLDDEPAMLDACPDHYIISRDAQGRQLVVETTGGSPLPSEFTVDYDDVSLLVTPPDPSFPLQVAGVARLGDGLAIGGVRHQFRPEGAGFRARLTVEFPRAMPPWMARQHEWHLATEFSNWILAAA